MDHTVRLWDSNFECYDILSFPDDSNIHDILILPDDRIVGSGDHNMIVWKSSNDFVILGNEKSYFTCLGLLPDNTIIAGNLSSEVCIWNLETRECIKKLHNSNGVKNLLITKNKIIIAKRLGGLGVYNLKGDAIFSVQTKDYFEYFCDLSEDIIACGSDKGKITIYDLRTPKVLNSLDMSRNIDIIFGPDNLSSMIKLPDGTLVVGSYQLLLVYNPITGEVIGFKKYDNITKVILLSNGKFIVVTKRGQLISWI